MVLVATVARTAATRQRHRLRFDAKKRRPTAQLGFSNPYAFGRRGGEQLVTGSSRAPRPAPEAERGPRTSVLRVVNSEARILDLLACT